MIEPGRKFVQGVKKFRYGFNGKENDNEVKGEGNQQDYGFRIYDLRLGKFLSVDPLQKQYPWYTPYQFAGNSPIANIDLDGREELWYNLVFSKEGTTVIGVQYVKEYDNRGLFDGSTTYHMSYGGYKIQTGTAIKDGIFERHAGGYETLLELSNAFVGKTKNHIEALKTEAIERNNVAWANVVIAISSTISEGQSQSMQASIQADVSFSQATNYASDASGIISSPFLFPQKAASTPTATTNKQVTAANGGNAQGTESNTATVYLPRSRYPESAQHIEEATAKNNGTPPSGVLNRANAANQRKENLKGISTKPNKDRDEMPPAVVTPNGNVSVKHINPSDNRGSGSYMGNQIRNLPNGTKICFRVSE